jgi:hypothetical protein
MMTIEFTRKWMVQNVASFILSVLCVFPGMIHGEPLPEWQRPVDVRQTAFELGEGKGEFHAWGRGRDLRIFFSEFLPALFERTIVPDRSHGFVPVASSHQFRVFGAYSRHIREGMVRVGAETDTDDLLVLAFIGERSACTIVILNRSIRPRRLEILWPKMKFTEIELVDPYNENDVHKAPAILADDATEIVVDPGAIVTLTSTALRQ